MPTSITVVATSTSAPPAANAAIAACFSRGRIWPCSSTTRKSRELGRRARRSNSAVAARACSASDSSTSGQTTNAWRPGAQLLADALVGAAALALAAATCVAIGWRPAGQLAQRRHVEVAVARSRRERARDRRRGHVQDVRREARPAPCASSARALAHAEAVLLVDDRDGEAVELDGVLDQRVRADDAAAARRCASLPSRSARRPAGVEPVSSAAGTSSPGMSAWSVAKCCSASVSVGAISAAWHAVLDRAQHRVQRDDGLARADLAHQQALHRPLGARGRRRSRPSRRRWSPVGVNGSASSSQRARQRRRLVERRRARPRARRARAQAQLRELVEQQLVERQPPPRPPSRSPKCAAASAAAPVGQPLGDAQRGGQRLDHVGDAARCSRTSARICVEVMPFGGRVLRGGLRAAPPTASVRAWLSTRKRLRALVLAGQHEPRPGLVLVARATAG